jgi:CheY-like chemotaxis protein
VQILTIEDERQYGLEHGAFSFITKSVTTEGLDEAFIRLKSFTASRVRRLLVVEDDPAEQLSVRELLGHPDVEISTAGTGAEALEALRSNAFDCVVLDLRLPDMSGFELLTEVQQDEKLRRTPIIVFTGRELSDQEEIELRKNAKSIVLKGVRSPERLLDEAALFLHLEIADLPAPKQRMLEALHESDEPLSGRKVLVVDDDIRNIFALNSLLERHRMNVITATNGEEAIRLAESTDDLALVLMDVMMPEMDGYETMRRIRSNNRFRLLPIIALTAKAMKGDREKCLEAGASDYVAKPVNTDQLMSLVRMWLHR